MKDSTLTLSIRELAPFSFPKKGIDYNAWVNEVVLSSKEFTLETTTFQGSSLEHNSPTWIIFMLLIGFSCLAISRSVYRKRFTMLYKTLGNWKLSKQIIRYEKVYTHPVNILMSFNFILLFPLFFSIVYVRLYSPSTNLGQFYFYLLIPLVIYLLVKLVSYQFSAWLWNEKGVIEEYLFQSNLFNKYLGVVFLILTSLVVYSQIELTSLAFAALGAIGLSAIFQLSRGVMIGLENGKHLFFIIAYLCTLEILPWLVFGKLITTSL